MNEPLIRRVSLDVDNQSGLVYVRVTRYRLEGDGAKAEWTVDEFVGDSRREMGKAEECRARWMAELQRQMGQATVVVAPATPAPMTDTERLARIRAFLRTLLEPMPLGHGPIRRERWSENWTDAQQEAYVELRKEAECEEAGGPMDPTGPWG